LLCVQLESCSRCCCYCNSYEVCLCVCISVVEVVYIMIMSSRAQQQPHYHHHQLFPLSLCYSPRGWSCCYCCRCLLLLHFTSLHHSTEFFSAPPHSIRSLSFSLALFRSLAFTVTTTLLLSLLPFALRRRDASFCLLLLCFLRFAYFG